MRYISEADWRCFYRIHHKRGHCYTVNQPIYQEANTEEKEDDAILLTYFKTRTHRLADGVNNPTETEEICAICQAGFEHEESIGTLGCRHEYHTSCIKQWLSRKKNCPMCRASVLP
ncbi:E3 ubiquitin-protein ligase MBR2-like isoform X4 [Solanum pennellii]|uniref:RING-type E3 ubiquitin transferase n=1 Tax=Solanum pennellii TaxID=28526 RepID=A0ABM1FTP2_SOLPN|nr:E3 ubiquitin-protein ligase MBR2-like isoform X4 [Solanum pennellii]